MKTKLIVSGVFLLVCLFVLLVSISHPHSLFAPNIFLFCVSKQNTICPVVGTVLLTSELIFCLAFSLTLENVSGISSR